MDLYSTNLLVRAVGIDGPSIPQWADVLFSLLKSDLVMQQELKPARLGPVLSFA